MRFFLLGVCVARGWRSWSSDQRNAESVLPEPVGAMTSVRLPWEIESHAPSWAVVGCGKAPLNQVRVGSENLPRMVSVLGVCGATRC